jgi:hypothetical protein
VQACLNGNHPPNYHPRLPVTIEALLDDGRQIVNAGASELHIHVRDETGLESLHPRCVDATMQALKAQLPDTLIGISTGAWIENSDDRLLEYIARWSVFPDYVSVNLSEKNASAPSVDSDGCCALPRRGIVPVKKGRRTSVQRPFQPRYEPSDSLSMSRSASLSFSMAANTSSTASSVLSRIVTDSMSFPSALTEVA